MNPLPPFEEHRIARARGSLYARDYAGSGPAFVLMHGFPDHSGIYDQLVPYLVAAGRRVVTFDFLGFGRSDRPDGATYDFRQLLEDLEATVEALSLGRCVPVAHDASGPAAINFCIEHPEAVESLCLMNSAYDDVLPVVWPEMITLFAEPRLAALSQAIAQSPPQFGWLLDWQKEQFGRAQPSDQRARFEAGVGALIADTFTRQPSSGPAFMQLASDFFVELARNTRRLPLVEALDIPVKIIWGALDPYITAEVARDRASHFRHASLRLLQGSHWVQADVPEDVAREMLS